MVPSVSAPLSMNFMLPVPEASLEARLICSDKSQAGISFFGGGDVVVLDEHQLCSHWLASGSAAMTLDSVSSAWMMSLAMV